MPSQAAADSGAGSTRGDPFDEVSGGFDEDVGVLVTRLKALAIRIQYGYNAEKAYEESQLKGEAAEMHKYAKIGATKDRNDGTGRGRGRGRGKAPAPYVRPGSQPGGYGYYGGGYAAAPYTPAYTQAYAPAPSAPSS
jgi:hypothetical protein